MDNETDAASVGTGRTPRMRRRQKSRQQRSEGGSDDPSQMTRSTQVGDASTGGGSGRRRRANRRRRTNRRQQTTPAGSTGLDLPGARSSRKSQDVERSRLGRTPDRREGSAARDTLETHSGQQQDPRGLSCEALDELEKHNVPRSSEQTRDGDHNAGLSMPASANTRNHRVERLNRSVEASSIRRRGKHQGRQTEETVQDWGTAKPPRESSEPTFDSVSFDVLSSAIASHQAICPTSDIESAQEDTTVLETPESIAIAASTSTREIRANQVHGVWLRLLETSSLVMEVVQAPLRLLTYSLTWLALAVIAGLYLTSTITSNVNNVTSAFPGKFWMSSLTPPLPSFLKPQGPTAEHVRVFETPIHGGPWEHISAQSIVLRQTYSSLLVLEQEIPRLADEADYWNLVQDLKATSSNLTQIIRRYHIFHRDWGNQVVTFLNQLSYQNQSIHQYATTRQQPKGYLAGIASMWMSAGSAPALTVNINEFYRSLTQRNDSIAKDVEQMNSIDISLDEILLSLVDVQAQYQDLMAQCHNDMSSMSRGKSHTIEISLNLSFRVLNDASQHLKGKIIALETENSFLKEKLRRLREKERVVLHLKGTAREVGISNLLGLLLQMINFFMELER